MKIKGYLTVFGGFWNYVLGFGFFRSYAVLLNPMMVFYAKGGSSLKIIVSFIGNKLQAHKTGSLLL